MLSLEVRKPATRRSVVAAFRRIERNPQSREALVNRFMGSAPVPPAWTPAAVEFEFGRRFASIWKRTLRHRINGDHAAPDVAHETTYGAMLSGSAEGGTQQVIRYSVDGPEEHALNTGSGG